MDRCGVSGGAFAGIRIDTDLARLKLLSVFSTSVPIAWLRRSRLVIETARSRSICLRDLWLALPDRGTTSNRLPSTQNADCLKPELKGRRSFSFVERCVLASGILSLGDFRNISSCCCFAVSSAQPEPRHVDGAENVTPSRG